MAIKYFNNARWELESGVKYSNDTYNSPLDVRTVVDTYADLNTLKTSTDFSEKAYDGMPVAVVNDTDSNNNGLYFYLENVNKFVKVTTGIRTFKTYPEASTYAASDMSTVGELLIVYENKNTNHDNGFYKVSNSSGSKKIVSMSLSAGIINYI